MPCWRCGAREVDPTRGPSPWKRGVRGGVHVLVCPECQRAHDWPADLDHCPSCGSWRLVRALGQVVCRECGTTVGPDAEVPAGRSPSGSVAGDRRDDLAADVDAALTRLWGRATDG